MSVLTNKPQITLRIVPRKVPVTFLCDTGADRTIISAPIEGVEMSQKTILVLGAGGKPTLDQYTKSTEIEDPTGRIHRAPLILSRTCLLNRLGRELLVMLRINMECRDGQIVPILPEEGDELDVMVSEARTTARPFHALDTPAKPIQEMNKLAYRKTTKGQEQTIWPPHVTVRYGKQSKDFQTKWARLGPSKIVLQTLWASENGDVWANVRLADEVYRLFRGFQPHVSIRKGPNTTWDELGKLASQVAHESTEPAGPGDPWTPGLTVWTQFNQQKLTVWGLRLNWVTHGKPTVHLNGEPVVS